MASSSGIKLDGKKYDIQFLETRDQEPVDEVERMKLVKAEGQEQPPMDKAGLDKYELQNENAEYILGLLVAEHIV